MTGDPTFEAAFFRASVIAWAVLLVVVLVAVAYA